MPGAPGHPEHLGPPGPVTRKQKSLISSPRPRSSPGRCSGPRRRMSVRPPPSSTSSPVPPTSPWYPSRCYPDSTLSAGHTEAWVGSRGPGSTWTLGGTPPPPMSCTRGSWPMHGIVLPAYNSNEKSLQAEPGEGAPAPNCYCWPGSPLRESPGKSSSSS